MSDRPGGGRLHRGAAQGPSAAHGGYSLADRCVYRVVRSAEADGAGSRRPAVSMAGNIGDRRADEMVLASRSGGRRRGWGFFCGDTNKNIGGGENRERADFFWWNRAGPRKKHERPPASAL